MRPTIEQYFARMARLVATRSTCLRRAVGCVLVDARDHVLSTGYNGVARGRPHCNEEAREGRDYRPLGGDPSVTAPMRVVTVHPHACAGAELPSGEGLDLCEAVHAEQNALLQCRDAYAVDTCYVTAFPCVPCTKLLLNSSCRRIVYLEDYPGGGLELWGRDALKINLTEEVVR